MQGIFQFGKASLACLACVGAFAFSANSYATTFSIDDFSIVRTRDDGTGNLVTSTIFSDDFNNNIAPNNPPYFINGTTGVEANGRYSFDPATNGAIFDATGSPGQVYVSSARFNPAAIPSLSNVSLTSTDIFTVTGVFDLIAPLKIREGYGIRLNDAGLTSTTSNLNDRLELLVRRTPSNMLAIQFRDSDASLDLTTLISSTDLDTQHDQIQLELRKTGVENKITARFAYKDGGVLGNYVDLTGSGTLFDGENFTRAEFRATTPVPIAPTLSLTLLGLASMFATRRKKA